jgi:hypothetical protein
MANLLEALGSRIVVGDGGWRLIFMRRGCRWGEVLRG